MQACRSCELHAIFTHVEDLKKNCPRGKEALPLIIVLGYFAHEWTYWDLMLSVKKGIKHINNEKRTLPDLN